MVRKGQTLSIALAKMDTLTVEPVTRECKLFSRGINRGYSFGHALLDQFGKGASSTADVYPAQAVVRINPIQKNLAHKSARLAPHYYQNTPR